MEINESLVEAAIKTVQENGPISSPTEIKKFPGIFVAPDEPYVELHIFHSITVDNVPYCVGAKRKLG